MSRPLPLHRTSMEIIVSRLGAFAPQSLDTILFATGGADIALTRFGICNMLMIHT